MPASDIALSVDRAGFVHVRRYDGSQDQSFDIIAQADGSKGIRNSYHGVALGATAAHGVSVRPYDGMQDQSFSFNAAVEGKFIRLFYDRTYGMFIEVSCWSHSSHSCRVITDRTNSYRGEMWLFVDQADGSTGLRKWEYGGAALGASTPAAMGLQDVVESSLE
ncbi:hypothetical protein K8O92_33230 (plasmid) [Nocardia asteroides]|nr:hypothetical protein K8O92_33230 [Nocardia asteroides]